MAHKKGQGSTKNGRDSNPQYRGVKLFAGEQAKAGSILVRQVGTPIKAGFNVRMGKDNTLYSIAEGTVVYQTLSGGSKVHVEPSDPKAPRPFYLSSKA
ncbi:MAG: 50S ribosomal protein L27 [Phycisphaerales bacterium]|jgi:large subunit ribosomal protein L27|nr:50S ribosomal protein L27 [Phycisphaerales bacterium]